MKIRGYMPGRQCGKRRDVSKFCVGEKWWGGEGAHCLSSPLCSSSALGRGGAAKWPQAATTRKNGGAIKTYIW